MNLINYRSIVTKSISIVAYTFLVVLLILVTAFQFSHPQFSYLVPFLILGLFVFLYQKPFWGILTLIILLPFHAFFLMLIRHYFYLSGSQAFWIAFWKELIILLLILVVFLKFLKKKKFPFKIISLDWLIIGLTTLGIFSAIFFTKNFSQALWGLRTDFQFFLVYFLARSLIKNKSQLKIILGTILATGLLVVLFTILQIYYWPVDFLLRFGYIKDQWVPNGPLQAYQTAGNLIRYIGTFSGAIQLGPYLAILILLSLSLFIFTKSKITKIFLGLFSIVTIFPLYHTFTRSAWLGLLIGFFALLAIFFSSLLVKNNKSKYQVVVSIVLTTIFLLGLGLGIFFLLKIARPEGSRLIDDLIHHRGTTLEHWEAIKKSLIIIKEKPFGLGIGKTGLAALRFNIRLLSENWYLQIATEMGILALMVFIGIMVVFVRLIYGFYLKTKDSFIKALSLGILVSFICFSVVGLFLHAWGDNTVVALTFWILAGGLIEYQGLAMNQNRLKQV